MENFVLYDEIGSGNGRIVYKGRRKGTIEYVAIHCIEKTKRQQIQNSVRLCHELQHDNIVTFKEWYETSNHLWLVVELCTGLSLRTILEQDSYLPESTVKEFTKHLVCGLAYLHSYDVLYVDLQPSKILLDGDATLKLSNFSLAKMLGECDTLTSQELFDCLRSEQEVMSLYGSPPYMAPEILNGELPTKSSELWSLGVVMYEMFTGTKPFKAIEFEELREQIMEARLPYPMQGQDGTFTKASENLYMLIQGLLQKDPSRRIDWLELCLHPFWDGELSYLADRMDTSASHNTLSSRCVSHVSNDEKESDVDVTEQISEDEETIVESIAENFIQEEKEELVDVKENDELRPDTVPKHRRRHNLRTRSLRMPEDKPTFSSSVQSDKTIDKITAWQYGTYKLDKGLAIMDLTEIITDESTAEAYSEIKSHQPPSIYSKTRDRKRTFSSSKVSDIDLDSSINSATTLGSSAVFPPIGSMKLNIIDHLYHPSDLIVTPIAENHKLLKLPNLKWENSALGFQPFLVEKLQKSSREELKGHIVQVVFAYAQAKKAQEKTMIRQKMSILAYLNTIIRIEEAANIVLEENLTKSLLSDLKTSTVIELKVRIGRVLGVIASSATYISPSYNMAEVFTIVTDQLKQNLRNSQIKQAFLPVVGEFLFYAATQEESEDKELPSWEPSSAVFTIISKCLQQKDDSVSQLFAAKIIENVTTTTGRYCKKLLTNDIGLGLWNLFIHATSDMDKVTAASALCRISMHSSIVIQHVCDRASLNSFRDGLYTGPQKSQQAFVTLFINLLSSPTHAKRISQDQELLQKILYHMEAPSLILRGKFYLFLSEMCMHSCDVMLACCESRLITFIERDSKRMMSGKEKKDDLEYVYQCLTLVVNSFVTALPGIVQGILHILDVVSGRHHPNPAQVKQLKTHLPLAQILLYMITSSIFRKRIVNKDFIQFIAKLLEQIRRIDTGEINLTSNATRNLSENIISTIFSIIEALTQHPPLLLSNQSYVIDSILPVLATFHQSEDGNLRILSLKLFSDISSLFLENEGGESARKNDDVEAKLFKIMESQFIPEFESFLQDQYPVPAYALKLLYAYTEANSQVINVLLEKNTVSSLLQMLRSYQGDINSSILQSIIGIINTIVSKKEIDFMKLCKQGLVEYLSSAFIEVAAAVDESTNVNCVSSLLLQLLDTLHHVLKHVELAVKNVLVNSQTQKPNAKHDVEDLLQESKVLAELNGILVNLLIYDDVDIRKWSCRCLYLSAELFGGEYEECLADDNIECVCQYLLTATRKQQKVMLRILKRLIGSNEHLLVVLNHDPLKIILTDLKDLNPHDNDDKSVKGLCLELLKMKQLSV